MRASTCVAVVVAMAVEGALFAAFWPKVDAKSEPVAEEGAAKTPDHSDETIKALKSHIAALEKRLADKDAAATDEKIDADPESRTAPEDGDGGGPGGRRMWRRPSLAEMYTLPVSGVVISRGTTAFLKAYSAPSCSMPASKTPMPLAEYHVTFAARATATFAPAVMAHAFEPASPQLPPGAPIWFPTCSTFEMERPARPPMPTGFTPVPV